MKLLSLAACLASVAVFGGASVQRPAAQARIGALVKRGLQEPGDLEDNLNKRTADYREPRD